MKDENSFGREVEEAKAYCLAHHLDKEFSASRFLSYLGDGGIALQSFKNAVGEVNYTASKRLSNSARERRRTAFNRFNSLIKDGWCWFITLTFSDDVLASTSHDTRRRYVARYLKSLSGRYVGNVDYGKKNGREHYHALIEIQGVEHPDFSAWTKYGFFKALPVGNSESDTKAVTKYVTKLTSHALKKSTTGSGRYMAERLIYGRGPRNRKVPPKWLVVD